MLSKPTVTLEPLSPASEPFLLALDCGGIPSAYVEPPARTIALAHEGDAAGLAGFCFVIRADDHYAGLMLLGQAIPDSSDPAEVQGQRYFRLLGFVLNRADRGQGIGSEALRLALKQLYAAYGAVPVVLECHRENPALHLYQRLGFRITGEHGTDWVMLLHPPQRRLPMHQTDHTAIVLRNAPYKDNDRMLTLLSPTRGRVDALARGCRRPRSPLLNASELFALGDFDFFERGGRMTVTAANLIETFYPLRADFDRLAIGTYLLGLCEAAAQPGQECQELFMLLLHTLSRLTFTDQEWKPLLAGFLLHYASINGVKPRLNHCISCGKRLSEDEPVYFDLHEGGLSCHACHLPKQTAVAAAQAKWMRMALTSGTASWVNTPDCYAPYTLLRAFVEERLDRRIRASEMLPK